jgi:uncharacterized protein (TIGR01777 family)
MKIVIPGGTGQVGSFLARALHTDGHEVVVLSRRAAPAPWRVAQWDGRSVGDWAEELAGTDVLINLAGRSVNCRYHQANRREIFASRIDSTRTIGQAMAETGCAPRVWLQSSTATIYAHRYDAANDETTGVLGGDEPNAPDTWKFSIEVARAWERAAEESVPSVTRLVKLRSAMIMSPDAGGVFDTLLRLVRFGLGGRAGDGRQYMSWIHFLDFVRSIYWLIEHDDIAGNVNLAAPNPLPNAQFMQALRRAWGITIGLPASRWMLEIGTALMRSESELILKSRRVVPSRLLAGGFRFDFPDWPTAAADLCCRWREGATPGKTPRNRLVSVH